jgi:uncharacterized protein YqjF (DUF2071 family)
VSELDLDRVTPTRRPEGVSRSGQQKWRSLLFLHWRLPAAALRAVVPRELELDLWEGQAYVGVVPFEMVDIRPAWLPGAFALDFLETNLRTYVHYRGEPGVYFFSLEASSRLAVQAARWGWSLPYHYARMEQRQDDDGSVFYGTVRASDPEALLEVSYRPGPALDPPKPGSLEFFLLERYYLFSLRRGRVLKGHVHHVQYPAHTADVLSVRCGLVGAAGLEASGPPDLAHYSPGVDVDVYGPWPVG